MTRDVVRWGLGLGLCLSLASTAVASVGPCNQTSEVTSAVEVVLSSTPARLCGVHMVSTAANGYCQVYDSPDGTVVHGQTRTVAEPSAATARDSASETFGDLGQPTRFGLAVSVSTGVRCLVHWGSTP